MARPREFELDEAVEGAMQIFWRQGYGATNLPDLLLAMGLTRGSFYKAFGDKRSVYLEALKRYDENNISAAVKMLSDAGSGDGVARIEKLFEGAFDGAALESERRGCLVCNAMVETGTERSGCGSTGSQHEQEIAGCVCRCAWRRR